MTGRILYHYNACAMTDKTEGINEIAGKAFIELNTLDAEKLGIADGETTPDGLFSLELVNCLGSCALAPVMVVDNTYYGKMTMEKLPRVLAAYREEG